MESNIKILISLFNWILNKGVNNLEVLTKEIEGDEILNVKISRNTVNLRYDPKFTWGSLEHMNITIHYALMLSSGYLIKKEREGWVCFKLGNGNDETRKKYDLPSVQQCSCLRTAYNQGDCRHIKMLKGYLLIEERSRIEYEQLY